MSFHKVWMLFQLLITIPLTSLFSGGYLGYFVSGTLFGTCIGILLTFIILESIGIYILAGAWKYE
jgi:hypothetical protein